MVPVLCVQLLEAKRSVAITHPEIHDSQLSTFIVYYLITTLPTAMKWYWSPLVTGKLASCKQTLNSFCVRAGKEIYN